LFLIFILPQTILNKYSLVNRLLSFKNIHFPAQIDDYYKAKERLVLDEFIYLRSIFSYLKSKQKELDSGLSYSFSEEDISRMKELLPFELTNSQKKSFGRNS
jgi:ATP-dependent DNA helicase RecG